MRWERALLEWWARNPPESTDPVHDIGHLERGWRTARALALEEGADLLTVLAASMLHDVVNPPKNHPDRSRASRMSAVKAAEVLGSLGFPEDRVAGVQHAVEAHSFSAGIPPRSVEARVVQDADRLESLGAIGVTRCFVASGLMRRAIADWDDPLGRNRPLDDMKFSLDHFEVKLLRLPDTMQTASGRRRAHERAAFLEEFRNRLVAEIEGRA